MAKKGNRSKGRMEMLKKFERLERERGKALKKAEKATKKAERKSVDDGSEAEMVVKEDRQDS